MQYRGMTRLSMPLVVSTVAVAVLLSTSVRAETPAPTAKALKVEKPFQVVILQGGSAAPWKKGRDVKFRKTVADDTVKKFYSR